MTRNVGGALDQAALAKLHFFTLDRAEQAAAIRRLAAAGHTEYGIAVATGSSVEHVRRALAPNET